MARGCRLQRATKGELVSLLAVICPQPHIGEDIRVSFVSEWLIVPPHPLHLAPLSLSKKQKQKKKNKSAKKSASNLATLSQTNRSVACFVAYKSILFHYLKKKTRLPSTEIKWSLTVTGVPVKKACLLILNSSRDTLKCIFHLLAAGMMAPHSKLNQTCIASRKTNVRRLHNAPPPNWFYWSHPGI